MPEEIKFIKPIMPKIGIHIPKQYAYKKWDMDIKSNLIRSPQHTNIHGILSGSFPTPLLESEGNPIEATVKAYISSKGAGKTGEVIGSTTVEPNGKWTIHSISMDYTYDVMVEIPGYNNVIISNVTPVVDPNYDPATEWQPEVGLLPNPEPEIPVEPEEPEPDPELGDEHWIDVQSLLHFNEDFSDKKTGEWKAYNNAQIDNLTYRFGGGSLLVPDSISGVRNTSKNIKLVDEFTLECWFYIPSGDSQDLTTRPLFSQPKHGTNGAQFFGVIKDPLDPTRWKMSFKRESNVADEIELVGISNINFNSHYHTALVFDGAFLRIYLNGRLEGSVSTTTGWVNTDTPFGVGSMTLDVSRIYGFNGYIDDARITGAARYDSTFAPPSVEFPSHSKSSDGSGGLVGDPHWDNVVSLLHFDGDLTDVKGLNWNKHAAVEIPFNTQSKFGTGGAEIYMQSLSVNSPSIAIGSGDFTVEMWVRIPTEATMYGIGYFMSSGYDSDAWFTLGYDYGISHFNVTGARIRGAAPYPKDVWHHVAFSRQSGMLRVFINGIILSSSTDNVTYTPEEFHIGGASGAIASPHSWFIGHIDEFRFTKDVARYTENFTPPTEPFPNFGI